ncbi:hypothetical protein HQQ81_20885 [Microbacteriaceae bacterium VKM Ac-2854]|nr:hypothetical protein [Microbacteriaceae bacterium VKM Ac-2854]
MNTPPPAEIGRVERTLAYMFVAIIAVVLIAFLAILLGPMFGVTDYSAGVWAFVFALPLVGLPIAFVMMIVLLIVGIRRRRHGN